MTDLPEGWYWTTLGELAADEPRSITDGPFGSNLTSAHYTESGARVIRLQNIGDGEFRDAAAYISLEHFETLRKHEVRAGDLLVASLGDNLPRACLMPDIGEPAIVKADCIRIRLRPDVDQRWVLLALQRQETKRWAEGIVKGVGRQRLGLKAIRSLPIPVPPLSEQRRLAAAVDESLAALRVAFDRDVLVSRLRLLRLSALREQFDGLRASVESKPLSDVAQTSLGKMLDAKRATGDPTPYLRNINVRWGTVDTTDVRKVPLTGDERRRFALSAGDILVCEGGEPGRCAVWDGGGTIMAFQKAIHRVRPSTLIDARFVALAIEEFIRSPRSASYFTGTTIRHLPQERLRSILLPVPSIKVQHAVADSVANFEFETKMVRRLVDTVELRTLALRDSLLDAAFSGRL